MLLLEFFHEAEASEKCLALQQGSEALSKLLGWGSFS